MTERKECRRAHEREKEKEEWSRATGGGEALRMRYMARNRLLASGGVWDWTAGLPTE
jgi:hypothetical protein